MLAGIQYRDGDVVPVTTVIAYILAPGETAAALPGTAGPAHAAGAANAPAAALPEPAAAAPSVTPIAARIAREEGVDLSKVPASGNKITREDVEKYLAGQKPAGRVTVAATPAARRVARENGLPLEAVTGSGPRGRVQALDVANAAGAAPVAAPAAAEHATGAIAEPAAKGREVEIVPLSSIRRTIARRMQQSFQESPHIVLSVEVDMTEAEAARKRLNVHAEKTGQSRITMTALIVKVVAWALRRHPYLNSSFNEDSISLWKNINIGVAAAAPQGLVVPVLKDADQLGVNEINVRLSAMADRARRNALKLDDVQGGTFTISNLGMFGIPHFRAVINPPESAILAVGSIVRRPVVIDEQDHVEVRPMLSLTLSADHRVIDGIVAARFLGDLLTALESPDLLLF
jgi:pyruvate dehydrogenase E2 component (dihydrolipoamide acetyltransferase)